MKIQPQIQPTAIELPLWLVGELAQPVLSDVKVHIAFWVICNDLRMT